MYMGGIEDTTCMEMLHEVSWFCEVNVSIFFEKESGLLQRLAFFFLRREI